MRTTGARTREPGASTRAPPDQRGSLATRDHDGRGAGAHRDRRLRAAARLPALPPVLVRRGLGRRLGTGAARATPHGHLVHADRMDPAAPRSHRSAGPNATGSCQCPSALPARCPPGCLGGSLAESPAGGGPARRAGRGAWTRGAVPSGAQAVLHGAFITLLLVWVLATVERAWSPRRLLLFGLLGAVCVLVAHSAAFVMAAALAGLALNSLLRRAWRRLAWSALTAAGVWAIQMAVYSRSSPRRTRPRCGPTGRGYSSPPTRPGRRGSGRGRSRRSVPHLPRAQRLARDAWSHTGRRGGLCVSEAPGDRHGHLWGAETRIRGVSRRSVRSVDALRALVDRPPTHPPTGPPGRR
jgi:hypothetical protein